MWFTHFLLYCREEAKESPRKLHNYPPQNLYLLWNAYIFRMIWSKWVRQGKKQGAWKGRYICTKLQLLSVTRLGPSLQIPSMVVSLSEGITWKLHINPSNTSIHYISNNSYNSDILHFVGIFVSFHSQTKRLSLSSTD